MTPLIWTETDGVWKAERDGFSFLIRTYTDPRDFDELGDATVFWKAGSSQIEEGQDISRCKHVCQSHANAISDAVERARKEERAKHYVPGVWKCRTCGFVQHRNIICPKGIYADIETLTEPCPNEGDVMFPMTWEEMAKENQEFGVKLLDRNKGLEEKVAKLKDLMEEARVAPWQSDDDADRSYCHSLGIQISAALKEQS